jgi:hypothetical protein
MPTGIAGIATTTVIAVANLTALPQSAMQNHPAISPGFLREGARITGMVLHECGC